MNRIFFIAITSLLLQACADEPAQEQVDAITTVDTLVAVKASRLDEVGWILGKWESKKPKGSFVENWNKINDSVYTGSGTHYDKDGKMLMSEQLQLLALNDTLWYLPTISGQNDGLPVRFKEASITDTIIVFENPQHDFPQRIVYKRLSDRTMLGYIEGTIDGKYQKVEFPFMRLK